MRCPHCQYLGVRKFGRNRNGSQRYKCDWCQKRFTDPATSTDNRRVSRDKMILCLRMLLEGSSIRSVQRLTGVDKYTIIANMIEAGENCARWMEKKLVGLHVNDVECDELWAFIGCKERHRINHNLNPEEFGDLYAFTAIERSTKLLFCFHVGKRDMDNTREFMGKVNKATVGRFQLSTDAFIPYQRAVRREIDREIDYATLKKEYENSAEDFRRRYSPSKLVFAFKTVYQGNPVPDRICTSIVERHNLSIRMAVRRLTRLTNAHSKKRKNHEAMLGLFFGFYNFVRVHSTIKQTPAMAHGLTDHVWTVEELLSAAQVA
jgi:transposase-like protein/IS1 family transposase